MSQRRPNRLSNAKLTFGLIGLLVLAIGGGYVVGVLASPRGDYLANPRGGSTFDWDSAGVAASAIATVLLAAFTGYLALTTSREVSATWQLADEAQEERLSRTGQSSSSSKPGPTAARMYGSERAAAVRAEWRAWREEWLERWQQGDPAAPGPPHVDVLDHYAKPG